MQGSPYGQDQASPLSLRFQTFGNHSAHQRLDHSSFIGMGTLTAQGAWLNGMVSSSFATGANNTVLNLADRMNLSNSSLGVGSTLPFTGPSSIESSAVNEPNFGGSAGSSLWITLPY